LVGAVSLHAAANVINDYYDSKFGIDRSGAPTTRYRPHPIILGILEPGDLVKMTVVFSGISLLIAIYLSFVSGYLAFVLGGLGLLFALAYTSPPFAYKYRALGEPFVLFCWGPIMVLGSYYVQTSIVNYIPVGLSFSIGLLVAAVLLANNIRDIEYDSGAGIKTIATILGRDGALRLYASIILSSYVIILLMVVLRYIGLASLIVYLTLPNALGLINRFRVEVPETADSLTAQLVLRFGLLLIAGVVVSSFI
jgi:1,4-dihydroxy-2-naphthoate octaprenyltransferase